jgi:hypothetical protein
MIAISGAGLHEPREDESNCVVGDLMVGADLPFAPQLADTILWTGERIAIDPIAELARWVLARLAAAAIYTCGQGRLRSDRTRLFA